MFLHRHIQYLHEKIICFFFFFVCAWQSEEQKRRRSSAVRYFRTLAKLSLTSGSSSGSEMDPERPSTVYQKIMLRQESNIPPSKELSKGYYHKHYLGYAQRRRPLPTYADIRWHKKLRIAANLIVPV